MRRVNKGIITTLDRDERIGITKFRIGGARVFTLYTFDGSGRFYYMQRQTFPGDAHRAWHKNDSSLDFTNRPHGRIAPAAYTGAIQTARCAGDFHRRNNAFIGIPARPVDHSDETYSRRISQPRPRPFIVNAPK